MAEAPPPSRRHLLTGALACTAFGLAPALAPAQTARVTLDSLVKGNTQGGTVEIDGVTESRGRVAFTVTLSLPAYFRNLDRYGSTRGNFGSGDLQLFWTGPTLGTRGDAGGLHASTQVHVEQWANRDLLFEKVRRQVSSRTYRADLRFETRWDQATGRTWLALTALRIPEAPVQTLRAVRAMVDLYANVTALTLRRPERLDMLAPEILETRYAVSGRGAGFDYTLRMSLDAALLRRLAAAGGFRDLDDPGLWHVLIEEAINK
ncbi:MAG: hypothetical protein EP318_01460 [Rhodobacteraceae bacterium]|nr:MAG: hypothetical protein EP318_01460 [Paracoccaceae bacterium]